jgi:Dynein heavy chain, N-terminal region 2
VQLYISILLYPMMSALCPVKACTLRVRCACLQVHSTFMGMLTRIAADPLLRSFAEVPGIETTLDKLLQVLEGCQNALYQFLELKRSQFPRCALVAAWSWSQASPSTARHRAARHGCKMQRSCHCCCTVVPPSRVQILLSG